jgi:hypothetical protein
MAGLPWNFDGSDGIFLLMVKIEKGHEHGVAITRSIREGRVKKV